MRHVVCPADGAESTELPVKGAAGNPLTEKRLDGGAPLLLEALVALLSTIPSPASTSNNWRPSKWRQLRAWLVERTHRCGKAQGRRPTPHEHVHGLNLTGY